MYAEISAKVEGMSSLRDPWARHRLDTGWICEGTRAGGARIKGDSRQAGRTGEQKQRIGVHGGDEWVVNEFPVITHKCGTLRDATAAACHSKRVPAIRQNYMDVQREGGPAPCGSTSTQDWLNFIMLGHYTNGPGG